MKLFVISSAALSVLGLVQALDQPHCRKTYEVVNGDSCQSIASKHSITKDHLSEWTKKINMNFDCDKIKPGEVICLDYESPIEKRSPKKAHVKKPAHPKKHTTTKKPVHRKKHAKSKKVAHDKDKREVKEPVDHKKKPSHSKKHATKPVHPKKHTTKPAHPKKLARN
ncbi:hypothetical protein RMCBS344292_19554 [Rhizopus microsporus]|nr:hypothetical protein RMCBS344292_04005 [Rhizopus microsporus]CEI89657.1 hypothetical protein RMCBS344292_04007 [Rhizopus microsporus]CEJ05616.1 hypothetical protein RMCBS344292_19554 [Rhizopus microsporus]